jgi:hypothetical protein
LVVEKEVMKQVVEKHVVVVEKKVVSPVVVVVNVTS